MSCAFSIEQNKMDASSLNCSLDLGDDTLSVLNKAEKVLAVATPSANSLSTNVIYENWSKRHNRNYYKNSSNNVKNNTSVVVSDDEIDEELKAINDANLVLETNNVDDISEQIWDKASHVTTSITPLDETSSSWAWVEFKGNLPEQATFYIKKEKTIGQTQSFFRQNYSKTMKMRESISNGTRMGMFPSNLVA